MLTRAFIRDSNHSHGHKTGETRLSKAEFTAIVKNLIKKKARNSGRFVMKEQKNDSNCKLRSKIIN